MADWAAMVESRNGEIIRLSGELEKERADKVNILKIVEEWCVEYNDVGGIDATDLAFRLGRAGYSFPETPESARG